MRRCCADAAAAFYVDEQCVWCCVFFNCLADLLLFLVMDEAGVMEQASACHCDVAPEAATYATLVGISHSSAKTLHEKNQKPLVTTARESENHNHNLRTTKNHDRTTLESKAVDFFPFWWMKEPLHLQVTWQTPSQRQDACCAFGGSHSFVPIGWIRKKQTAVSHSSTEADTIASDSGLRLEGLPLLSMWDTVTDVLELLVGSSPMHNKPKKTESLMAEKRMTDSIYFVSPNARISSQRASLFVSEDDDAVIKMITKKAGARPYGKSTGCRVSFFCTVCVIDAKSAFDHLVRESTGGHYRRTAQELSMCDQKEHANTEGELQMGTARANGCRRLDEEAWEQYYDAATVARWSLFNRG